MAAEDRFYDSVAKEISAGHIDKATWTRAFAHSGGDQEATKAHYCRYRAEHLAGAFRRQANKVRTVEAKHHGAQLLWGVLALAGGLGITTLSYANTQPGGHYLAATGLSVGGLVYTWRGLAGLARTGIGSVRSSK